MVKRYEDDNQKSALTGTVVQPELFAVSANEQMSTSLRATWLSDMLRAIENKVDASEIESFILPLLLYKYLSDTFDEVGAIPCVEEDLNNGGTAGHVWRAKTEREPFSFPGKFRWEAICNYPPDGTLGQFLTAAMREMANLNPFLRGVVDIKDYDEYRGGQRVLDDKHLKRLIDVLSLRTLDRAHCGLDTLNIAYDYFLRYSLETARNKAGAFYTPQDVVRLAVKLLEPTPKSTIYDPACGSGEFLKSALHHVEKALSEKGKKLKLYGQESVPTALAMAKMQMFLRSSVKADITAGDALREPHFIEDGKLKRFDRILTNPPWNQSGYDETFYKRDKWGRFDYGTPPKFSADWGWVQHILASLDDHGRAAVLLDIGAVSRGSGSRSSHKERDIRRALVKLDVIEGAILLPGKLFDKTAAPSLLLLLNRSKPPERKNQILLVDASNYSSQGRAATLRDEDIDAVYEVYKEWETRENFSRVVTVEEICACDYDLSPLLLVEKNIEVHHRPLEAIERDLAEIRRKREHIDAMLANAFHWPGFTGQEDDVAVALTSYSPFLAALPTNMQSRRMLSEAKRIRICELALEQERRADLMQQLFTYCTSSKSLKLTALSGISQNWDVAPMKELAEIRSGFTPSKVEFRLGGGQTLWVRATDLYQGIIKETSKTIPEAVTDDRHLRRAKRPVDTVLMAIYGGPSTVGKTGILGVQAATNQCICCIRPDAEMLDAYYLLCYLTHIRPSWIRYAIGSRLNITMRIVQERLIPVPPLEEQREIADRLRPYNTRISQLEREVAVLQEPSI